MADQINNAAPSSMSFAERVAHAEAALVLLRGPMTAAVLDAARQLEEALAKPHLITDHAPGLSAALDIAHNLKGLAGATGNAVAATLSCAIYDRLLNIRAADTQELDTVRSALAELRAQLANTTD